MLPHARAFLDAVQLARDTLPHGKRPTGEHVRVAAKLAFWRRPNPSHRALARAACVSVRTVQRALARLHALGLLSWTRQVVACVGWRAQIASRYALCSQALTSYQVIEPRSSGKLSPPGARAAPAGDLLAARRAVMAARLRGGRPSTLSPP